MEIWKSLNGYNDLYEVSNLGNVRNKKTGIIKTASKDRDGYFRVYLRESGKDKERFVHRLAAISFIENPYEKPEVNHIDGNKQNNKLSNLEWVTGEENEKHAILNGLITAPKPVVGTHKATKKHFLFESINDAARRTKESKAGIRSTISGRQLGTKNYYWSLAR